MSRQGVECANVSKLPGAGACALAEDVRCEWPPGLAIEPQASQRHSAPTACIWSPSTVTKGPGNLWPLTSL